MNAQVAATGRPSWAHWMWCDDNNIYIELDGMHGPYITCYPLSEGGLTKALHLMRDAKKKAPQPMVYQRPGVVIGYKPKGDYSERQREQAREILKKMGIT